jgi:hypothetical protein
MALGLRSVESLHWAANDAAWLSATRQRRRWECLGIVFPALALAVAVGLCTYSIILPALHPLIAALTIVVAR